MITDIEREIGMYGKIGCRAHDYGRGGIEEIAVKITDDGYQTIQLALKKALVEVVDLKAALTKEYASYLSERLKSAALNVSVLGAYLNYACMDDGMRDENIEIMKKHLRIAKPLGCRMIGTETGSLDDGYGPHPDNHGEQAYQRFKDAISSVLPVAEENDAYLGVEAVSTHIIHTPERMHRLIEEIDNDRLKVIFDISNLMTEDNWDKQNAIMDRMFELMEDRIWVVHVKDFDFVDGRKVILPIGEGRLNVDHLMELVRKSSQKIDVLAENVPVDELTGTFWKLVKYIDR